jgi:hypothetical protein
MQPTVNADPLYGDESGTPLSSARGTARSPLESLLVLLVKGDVDVAAIALLSLSYK